MNRPAIVCPRVALLLCRHKQGRRQLLGSSPLSPGPRASSAHCLLSHSCSTQRSWHTWQTSELQKVQRQPVLWKKKKLYTDFKFFCNKNKFPFIFTVEVLLCHLKCTKRYPLVVAPTKVAGRHKIQAFKTKNLKIFKDANGKRNRNLSSRCGSSLT